jgi:hypothetical protein
LNAFIINNNNPKPNMKKAYPLSLIALGLATAATAQEVVQIDPLFDSGRVATNDLATTNFGQWSNGTGSSKANNVGWNETRGIWYSFIRFAGERNANGVTYGLSLADWHSTLSAAGSVTLRGDVSWVEINPDFPGAPGVPVSIWLVPGLDIPEGSLPTFDNTWPWNYANAVKVTSVPVEEMSPLRASWNAAEADPINTREDMSYAFQVDLTDAIKAAIAAGHMTPETPWGIVLFPEEMETQLNVPNNPQWIDRRGTVFQGSFWEIVIAEGEAQPTEWAGYAIDESGWVDTGAFMGMVYPLGDFVYALDLGQWIYLPESFVVEGGAWTYLPR